jgi:hypothetical protein
VRKTLTAVIVLVTASSWLYLFDRASSNGEAAVRRAEQTWGEAIVAKSLDQTIAFYAPDAVTAGSAMFLRAGGGVSGRMGQAFCGSFVHLYVENGARRCREIRVDRILERNLGRGARSWPLSYRVAETAKRPMGSPYRRGLVSPLGQRNRAIGASIASLASPSCPTTVRLTRAYCFFSKGCFFRNCSK